VGQEFQEFQVGKAEKKGRVGQVGQVGWCVKVWEGGPEGSGGVSRKFLYCVFSHSLVVGIFINNWSRLFAETVHIFKLYPMLIITKYNSISLSHLNLSCSLLTVRQYNPCKGKSV
jgi:hypothetical protein